MALEYVYHRGRDPRASPYVVLFADGFEAIRGYGKREWRIAVKHLTRIPEWVFEFADEYYGQKLRQEEVDPNRIVSDAGVWDDEDFTSELWFAHESELLGLTSRNIHGFKTEDGAVVFPGPQLPVEEVSEEMDEQRYGS